MDELRKKIIKRIYELGEVHIGSCMSCVEILLEIKGKMKEGDTFILSKAHAQRAADIIDMPGEIEGLVTYCNSVGNGIGIGLGVSISNPDNIVYILVGDGEMSEGSNWEAINYIYKNNVPNIQVYVDCNGFGAYQPVSWDREISADCDFIHLRHNPKGKGVPELEGRLESHYHKITPSEYDRWCKGI